MYKIERTRMQLAAMMDNAANHCNDHVVIPLMDEEVRAIYEQKKHEYAVEDVMSNAEHPELFKENPEELEAVVSEYLDAMDVDDTWHEVLMNKIWDAEARLKKTPKVKSYTSLAFAKDIYTNMDRPVIFGINEDETDEYKIVRVHPFEGSTCYIISDSSGSTMEMYHPRLPASTPDVLWHYISDFFARHPSSSWAGVIYVERE